MSRITVPWVVKPKPRYGPVRSAVVAAATLIYRVSGPILRRGAGLIMLAAVAATVLLVWACRLLFDFIDGLMAAPGIELSAGQVAGGPLGIAQLIQALEARSLAGWLAYPLHPLQFLLARDLVGVVAILGFVSLVAVFAIWWERKVAARIQSRPGPMRVGLWHGWAQSPADGLKLLTKEDLIPADADHVLFRLAPYFAFVPVVTAFVALPFATYYVVRDLDVGLLFILALLGVEVLSTIMAGWASNNKWSVYGAMREGCQMVSYEIPMGMTLLLPIMCVGTLRLTTVGDAQDGGWFTWLAFKNPFMFIGAWAYFIAALASCKRAPFDLPESESELVAGFHTEYSGYRWCLFFFAEYAAMFAVCALAVILFLGGWHSPLPAGWGPQGDGLGARLIRGLFFSGPIWFTLKCVFLLYVQLWLRWTLPRIRIDQVLYACVQVMLPLAMLTLLGNTVWLMFDHTDYPAFHAVSRVVSFIMGLVGLVFAGGFIVIMGYGWLNRWRLVGTQAQKLLPGS